MTDAWFLDAAAGERYRPARLTVRSSSLGVPVPIALPSRPLRLVLAAAAALLLAAPAGAVASRGPGHSGQHHRAVCPDHRPGLAHCDADVVTDDTDAGPLATEAQPFGYGPAAIQSAYGLPSSTAGAGRTIAIVDAYDDPSAEADLATYRAQYGLTPCTTANGCFRKVGQTGTTSYPAGNVGWGQEISLDLDMASATCPQCAILLVEANSNTLANLGVAADYAAAHASVVSNSYGGSEFGSETTATYDGHYDHPGVPITASSGDDGYGVEFPAASEHVTAVGGTSLTQVPGTPRGWTETAWSGAGSGCSAYVAKPAWEHDASCPRRTVTDVSAVADPNTGVAVYDSYGSGGWLVFGGTSASAPIVAGAYALLSDTGTLGGGYFAAHPDRVFDVTSGSNGSCTFAYLCTAGPGYDGPTGLGTPNLGGAVLPPPQAPAVTTGAATPTSTGATVTGTVNPEGSATTYHVDYGTTTGYGASTASTSAGSGASSQPVSVTIGGLQPSTAYHARLVASNAAGTTYGDDVAFTTSAGPATHDVAPSALTVASGSTTGGGLTSLAALDGATFDLASTTATTPVVNWSATFPGVARTLTSLQVTLASAATRPCTQELAIYDATGRVWTVLDTRAEGTTQATTTLTVAGTLSRYVGGTGAAGNVRVRVKCTGSKRTTFTQRSDLLRVTWGG